MKRHIVQSYFYMSVACLVPLLGGCNINSPTQGTGMFSPPASITADTSAPEGVVTLYARDPLARTFCFSDGQYGGVIQGNEVRNRRSDIDFDSYFAGSFTVGVEGSRRGTIIDLGTADSLRIHYGYEETVGGGQGFASLRIINHLVYILKDFANQTIQLLDGGDRLFTDPMQPEANAPVGIGHVYLIRITDAYDPDVNLLVKIYVVSYEPGDTVTIRYHVL